MSDYQELPCRRCGRVWKWAFDKKSEPCCPEGYGCNVKLQETTIKEMFNEVLKRLDDIEMKIRSVPTVYPDLNSTIPHSLFQMRYSADRCYGLLSSIRLPSLIQNY